MLVSGKTKIFGVIGDPIEHSLSPIIQNAAFSASKLDCAFLAFKVKDSELGKALDGVRGLDIQGLNVTMPHKNGILGLLDEVDQTAKLLKAVNTVKNQNGKLLGFNTDGAGAMAALRENGVEFKGKKVMLLGAGGAARAIGFALAEQAGELSILNRSIQPAAELAELVYQKFNTKVFAYTLSPLTVRGALIDTDLLINATSVGMEPNAKDTIMDPRSLKSDLSVMDIVYNPIETRLAKNAKKAGAKVVSGVEMLIYQGAASFEIWTGQKAPIEVMREAALNHLRKEQKS
jgi:shikimate dehydrogenase